MKTKEEVEKMSVTEYIFWLNSMTTSELRKQFPGGFHELKASDSQAESVTNMLANDAILWRMTKEHAQYLASLATSGHPCKQTACILNEKKFDSDRIEYGSCKKGDSGYTYDNLKSFLETLSEDQLNQPILLSIEEEPVRKIYPSITPENYYVNIDDNEDGGTEEELREIYRDDPDFDMADYKISCPKGTVLFFEE